MLRNIILLIVIISNLYSQDIILNEQERNYLNNKKVIKMCVDPEWEPFEKIDTNGKHVGISADLIALIASRLNIKIELLRTKTWEDSLKFSQEKKCDVMSFLNQTPKREEWLVFTNTLFTDTNVLVGRSENDYIEDISKEKLTVALPIGTSIGERFAKDYPNLTIIKTNLEDEAFKLVEEKKADVTLRSLIITAYTIKKNGIFNLKVIGEPVGYENHLKMGVRKDEPILKDILNKGIATLTKDDIDNVINKHVTIVVKKVTKLTVTIWIVAILVFITIIVFVINYLLSKKIKLEVEKNLKQNELLIQSKRKAELGGMIANISHQWKNALNKISSNNLALMVQSQYQDSFTSKEIFEYTNNIEHSIKFMSQTMNIFLNFYKDSENKEIFDIKDTIDDAMQIMDIKVKISSTAINIIENEKLEIEAIKNEWIHVWLNILNNAINASTKNNISNPKIDIQINNQYIIVEDNCGGFLPKTLEQINKNIYTLGLGIQITKDILEKYGYDIKISNIENGSKIEIIKT